MSLAALPAGAQTHPISNQQRATANQVAQAGVPLNALKADAPSSYRVKAGDTLWGISNVFLTTAWRWPELWGMNLADIRNPHLIYPGQTLFLDTSEGRARLRMQAASMAFGGDLPTVKVSPRTRVDNLASSALPTLQNKTIEPFLAEPVIVDELTLNSAPRIVAAQDSRVLLTRGDRAYARGAAGAELTDDPQQRQKLYRVFRNATPLKDPLTAEVLGYEAQYVGKASLVRSETTQTSTGPDGKAVTEVVPATIDIIEAKEEMRVGDRLLPEPPREFQNYLPHAPAQPVDARIVSVYGSAVANASQNQVVTINRGKRDGMESGHVLAILQDGARLVDKTDATLPQIKLPDERNGLLMVFRTFERVSYALVLDITSGVKIGDHLVNPN
ncbi:LysM domain-containing protein [Rhodoferax sp.]|uniref:LysM peptidoglycan-binding domain-containing protein n=1 Tax=Rhodoferax sp. TaxID=50421 RepID=UPI002607C4CE|nr:LysM domain-containing protein [Rhodoferax sp.]MDD2808376.1 LysM domain-containing protein [Rhodoferax sp.]MDD4942974.1 LysM domain-containing protein [Rhodoferax sp.]MDD5480974.1 LysM domain-containing protein [Rhodoferax sp.]